MSEWNTNLDEAPEAMLLLSKANGCVDVGYVSGRQFKVVAWMPLPEPYKPAKPKQYDAEDFAVGARYPESGGALIRMVEQRTREIVAWEQEHGDD